MVDNIKGVVYNIQGYSIDDGPGIRTTVFLKGCPLQCLWCSNPESQQPYPEISHSDSLCNKCGKCVEICELKAVSVDDTGVHIDRKICTNCGRCVEVCAPQALRILGKYMSVEEVFYEVNKDKQYYQVSGGGVTASGGEPLLQPDFVAALFKKCRESEIHTCLETCGFGAKTALDKVLPYTSLVLFDIKHVDSVTHQKLTGKSNEQIFRNLEYIIEKGVPIIIRAPMIPGYNDSDLEITALAQAMVDMKLKKIDLMPYHKYGLGKYKMLDRQYELGDVNKSEAKLEESKAIFKSFGLECDIVK
ncbi:MAG: glycyl-radical enzyme activating protein [Dehalococcoidales bacterium]|nr:glycyl-radical enzyme activating protein [Dehalococcoidales bacterium]